MAFLPGSTAVAAYAHDNTAPPAPIPIT
jgi:hypothetical protein